jgi:hypothetical protein
MICRWAMASPVAEMTDTPARAIAENRRQAVLAFRSLERTRRSTIHPAMIGIPTPRGSP